MTGLIRGNQSVEQWPDGSTITVAYDGFARLTRYKVGVATQDMLYNGEDERIRIVTTPAVGPADTRIYVYDLDHRIVGEYGAAGVADIKAEYIWTLPEVDAAGLTGGDDGTSGYMPLAIVKGAAGEINWVHSHHNGKPILLTNASGTTVAYSGHAVLGFPGQFANAVGLAGAQYYYNRYRDYNDATGRYIQADPIGLAGDANPYAYAMGNTLRYSDPTGEFVPLGIIAGAFAAGFVSDIAMQAGLNWLQGHDVFDPKCYNWGQAVVSGGLSAIGSGPGILVKNIVTVRRITKQGTVAIRRTYPSGRVLDISPRRVKEFVPNTHPNARPGSLQPVRVPDSLPGTNGLKRAPNAYERSLLDQFK
jgi:RHS repeat-associated protein